MELLNSLFNLVERLYGETEGYLEEQSDAQLWYNRGYANGMVSVLRAAGYGSELALRLNLDAADLHNDDRLMTWAQAYHHGYEMGRKETREVLPIH